VNPNVYEVCGTKALLFLAPDLSYHQRLGSSFDFATLHRNCP
jgi:hypothetical protein